MRYIIASTITFIIFLFTFIPAVGSTLEFDSPESTDSEVNNWGGKLIKSPFGLGIDLQTKYVWRGMEMITEDSAPVLFPSVNYSWKGLYVYFMGGYAINGKYAEVDAGISYTVSDFTVGLYDYYYPTISGKDDSYTERLNTGHWLEVCLNYAPSKIPIWLSLSNFFAGADKYIDGNDKEKQAYSTYFEIGTYSEFLRNNRISLGIGTALNKSCYNDYSHGFGVCNIELKYTYNVIFKSGWTLPLSTAFIYNPVFDKPYVNFSANFSF